MCAVNPSRMREHTPFHRHLKKYQFPHLTNLAGFYLARFLFHAKRQPSTIIIYIIDILWHSPESRTMSTSTIEIPTEILDAARLTPDEIKVELAMQLYKQGRINPEQARILAGESLKLENLFQIKEQVGHIDMAEFISWGAHDLKSPLNAIIGFTKVVLKGIDGPVTELQVTDLTSAHVNGQRMLALTSNLIDMARLNNADIKIEINDNNLAQVITDATNRWKTQNPGKELSTSIDIKTPETRFDSARMRQVVVGMLTYAGNHVAEKGKVSLHARDDDKSYIIDVESSGEKARDKFELDLAMLGFICRGLINLHGGNLELGEDSGTGFALRFTLPKP
jgi:signal transduction histidine kinase